MIPKVQESWANKLWEYLRDRGSQTSLENSALISNMECRSKFSMDMNEFNPPNVRTKVSMITTQNTLWTSLIYLEEYKARTEYIPTPSLKRGSEVGFVGQMFKQDSLH